MLQGEDYFLDSLAETHRDVAWKTLAERAAETDLFIAPSNYFAELMSQRLSLPADRVRVVYNGVNLDGFDAPEIANRKSPTAHPPVLGYFARMCREKGLDRLVEAFILLKRRDGCRDLKLHIGGGCGPSDEPFVESLRVRLKALGVMHDVEFHPNLTRKQKIEFLRELTVFSVPALYGEAFGLYVIEALASGVPVVQPRAAAFPELVQTTGGGVLYEPGEPKELADAVEQLLARPEQRRAFGEAGRKVVLEKFTSECMARNIAQVFQEVCSTAKEPVRA
jgi:glycosyltransferase involved in cell wall biosynthesis